MLRFSFVLFLILLSTNLQAKLLYKSSFALVCKNTSSPNHLTPLSFFEFEDIGHETLNNNSIETLEKLAPHTFKNLKQETSKQEFALEILPPPDYAQYDPNSPIPEDCSVIAMIKEDTNHSTRTLLNKQFWNQLTKEKQSFFLFDYNSQSYLKKDLESVDYRRFSLFLTHDTFEKYNDHQKIDFFKYYGINEYNYSGVSLNLKTEVLFYENTDILKDAFPFTGATYEGALIDQRKFISFSKNKSVIAIATTSPFTKSINGQDFKFYIPAELKPEDKEDPRYEPRMYFFDDGNVKTGIIKPVDHFLNLITEIKSSLGIISVSFYPNNIPKTFYMGDCSIYKSGCDGQGKILYDKNPFKISYVKWYENKNLERLVFAKRARVEIPGNGTFDLEELYFDENGIPKGAWP